MCWDTFQCHSAVPVKNKLHEKGLEIVLIPGGCTGYVQAPDVSWNRPFKAKVTEKYNNYMASVGLNRLTKSGNIQAIPRKEIVSWIIDAWVELESSMIRRSFKVCRLTTNDDEWEDITCFKKGRQCEGGAAVMHQRIREENDPDEEDPFL